MRISDWSSDVCSSDLFEPGVPAVATVAMVALQADRRLDRLAEIFRWHEDDRRREARIGLRLVVRHPEPAAERQIEALQHIALEEGDHAEIFGQHVDRVFLGNGEADLELARQIGLAVVRLCLGPRGLQLLAGEPDLRSEEHTSELQSLMSN